MPTPNRNASKFQAAVFVGRFLVLLPPHSNAVEERRNGHENHDANGHSNAAEHGSGNDRSKFIHGLILRNLR